MSKQANFDRIAPFYDLLAGVVFGNKLELAQRHFLSHLESPGELLILGGGTGNILEPLVSRYPEARIDFLETSENMMALANARFSPAKYNINYVNRTEEHLQRCSISYDVIITPFVLDVFEPIHLNKIVQQLMGCLKNGGIWVNTDFHQSQRPWWGRYLIRVMYSFFKVTTGMKNQQLPDFENIFGNLPLVEIEQKSFFYGIIRTVMYKKT